MRKQDIHNVNVVSMLGATHIVVLSREIKNINKLYRSFNGYFRQIESVIHF